MTSVPWFHRWLFIVFVLDGCDDALYVNLATTPEFITLSPVLVQKELKKKKQQKEMLRSSSCFSIFCVSGRALVVL